MKSQLINGCGESDSQFFPGMNPPKLLIQYQVVNHKHIYVYMCVCMRVYVCMYVLCNTKWTQEDVCVSLCVSVCMYMCIMNISNSQKGYIK